MSILTRLLRNTPTVAAGAVAFTLTTQPAFAFFPPFPPAGGPVTSGPPLPPVSPPPLEVPPVPPPPFELPPPPPVPQIIPPGEPGSPQVIPEPSTVVTAVIGLSVLGGYAWRRRKRD
jgi:hypothetical protein